MRHRIVVLALGVALLSVGSLAAQETTGRIEGRIVDAQSLPVPGVTVTATGPQGEKIAITDTDGRFTVPLLTPGTYQLRAELQNFKTAQRNDINVSLGQTVDVGLQMEVGNISETVTVVGAAATIDPKSTTTGGVIDSDFARTLPIGRRISDITYMAPGVGNSGSVGSQNPSISGGSGLDNQYVIDGANITNQGYGALGSYSIIFGSLGNAIPFDFFKDVEVKTGGYEAEFGQSMGGVVNVITKSGTNNLRGSLFGYTRPTGLEGTWKQYQSVNGTVQTLSSQLHDAGVEGGGPVIRNRVFFFGAVDSQWETQTFQAPAGSALFNEDGYDRKRRNMSYSAKGTAQLNSAHRIDASFFGDPSHGDMGPQRASSLLVQTTASFSEIDYGGHNQTVRYDGILGRNWLVEGAYARAVNKISELPSVDEWRVTDTTVSPQRITGGVGFYEAGNRSLNNQWTVKSTNIIGDHQVKYGFAYDDVAYTNLNQRTGPTFLAPDGRTTATGAQITILTDPVFERIYRVTRANFNSGRDTAQKYWNFFVQDSWKADNRLTISPGLRYEQETLDGVQVKGFALKNNWAPRIGAAYDATGNGKTKIFGNWGRFFARIPNDVAARHLSRDDLTTRADYFDAALTLPIPPGVTAGGVTNHYLLQNPVPGLVDPDARMSYINEFALGIEREVMANTTFGIRYLYRNIGLVLEDIGNAPVVYYETHPEIAAINTLTNPSSNSPIRPDAQYLGASFDDPLHTYQAVEVTLNRRFAQNWSLMTSYRWSRLRGNYDGFYRDDNGQSDPAWTSLFDFPTNDPSYTAIGGPVYGYQGDIRFQGADGILPLDRPHQFKAFGNHAWNNGLNIGLGLNLSSGKPLTPLAANPLGSGGGEIPTAPRASGIQTIDGFRTRSPFESQVDLQASYNLKLTGARNLTLIADIFNVFNERRTLGYDTWTEQPFRVPNPDFGAPVSRVSTNALPQFQMPIQVRIGARFSF
jgi:Carboxypeptidase regulatory-like domain/TonB dependent receptor-like, beta-barrel